MFKITNIVLIHPSNKFVKSVPIFNKTFINKKNKKSKFKISL